MPGHEVRSYNLQGISMKEDYENCIGCLLRKPQVNEDGQKYEACKLAPVNKNNEACPCSLCLIKIMCKHGCDEYKSFRDAKFKEGIKNGSNK